MRKRLTAAINRLRQKIEVGTSGLVIYLPKLAQLACLYEGINIKYPSASAEGFLFSFGGANNGRVGELLLRKGEWLRTREVVG